MASCRRSRIVFGGVFCEQDNDQSVRPRRRDGIAEVTCATRVLWCTFMECPG